MIDIGTSSLRAGYAGDDAPKAIIPTAYGYHPALPDNDVTCLIQSKAPCRTSPSTEISTSDNPDRPYGEKEWK